MFTDGVLLLSPITVITLSSRMNRIAKAGDGAAQLLHRDRASMAGRKMTTDEIVSCAEHPLSDLVLAQMVIHLLYLP
jgi:hypothetical protein